MEVEEIDDDLAGENVGNEVQLEIEQQSLLSHNQPTYLRFRLGRQPQPTSKCSRFVMFVFKVTFCSLGLWGHQAWNYIPRVLLSAICVYQTAFVLSFDIGCPNFDCTFRDEELNFTQSNGTKVDKDSFYVYTQNGLSILFLLAAPVSYLVMIGCFIISKSKDSAMVSPSMSMVGDIQRRHVFLLLITMSFSGVFCWMFATVFTPKALSDGNIYSLSLALLWASLTTCSVFAVSLLHLVSMLQVSSTRDLVVLNPLSAQRKEIWRKLKPVLQLGRSMGIVTQCLHVKRVFAFHASHDKFYYQNH